MGYYDQFLQLLATHEPSGIRNTAIAILLAFIDKHGYNAQMVDVLARILTESVCKPQMRAGSPRVLRGCRHAH